MKRIQGDDSSIKTAIRHNRIDILPLLMTKSYTRYQEIEFATLAIEFGHIDIVKFLVKECDNGLEFYTYVTSAAQQGHFHVLKYLVEQNSVTKLDRTVLTMACLSGDLETVSYVLPRVDEIGDSLSLVVGLGHVEIAKSLLNRSTVNLESALLSTTCIKQLNMMELLVSRGAKVSDKVFKAGIETNSWSIVEFLLKHIDFIPTSTHLNKTICWNRIGILDAFVSRGAVIKSKYIKEIIDSCDKEVALHVLKQRADVEKYFFWAVEKDKPELVRCLSKRVNLSKCIKKALILATKVSKHRMIRLLKSLS